MRNQRADEPEPTPAAYRTPLVPLPFAPVCSVTPRFVGRETELSCLQAGLEQAIQGQRQVLFVSGEAGIGKTALVDSFLDQARSTGEGWIGRGLCVEHYGAGEAYLPVLDALGRLCREPAGKHFLSLLGRFAPTWLVQMPAFLNAAELDALQRRTQGVSQERMLREMAEALEALTSDTPLILVLEDLQWSDYSTFDFVSYLAHRREPARLFLIGTYRPGEVLGGHPLMSVKQELQAHGQSTELPLELLTEEAVGGYLSRRFPGTPLPAGLAQVVYQRTEGNPLFMVSLANDLTYQGIVDESEAGWMWREEDNSSIIGNVIGVPENLGQLIEKQIEQLSQEEQQVLEAASVAGAEFSVAALAAGLAEEARLVEKRCTTLARRGQFLSPRGVSEWPDGTVAGRYGFIHSLYQDVLSKRLTPGQHLNLQRRIGERKEAAYGPRSGEIAAELAAHFEEGRDYPRAIQYLQQAAENARRRWAYHEAVSRLSKGLGLLHHLPDSPERTQQELQLHFMLTEPLVAIKGAAAPEVEQSYTQTWELYQQLGKTAQPFWTLLGLWGVHFMRSELQQASELDEQLFVLAEQEQAPLFLYWAQHARALTTLYRGDLLAAHAQLEQAVAMYDAQSHPYYMIDPQGYLPVACGSCLVAVGLSRPSGEKKSIGSRPGPQTGESAGSGMCA